MQILANNLQDILAVADWWRHFQITLVIVKSPMNCIAQKFIHNMSHVLNTIVNKYNAISQINLTQSCHCIRLFENNFGKNNQRTIHEVQIPHMEKQQWAREILNKFNYFQIRNQLHWQKQGLYKGKEHGIRLFTTQTYRSIN